MCLWSFNFVVRLFLAYWFNSNRKKEACNSKCRRTSWCGSFPIPSSPKWSFSRSPFYQQPGVLWSWKLSKLLQSSIAMGTWFMKRSKKLRIRLVYEDFIRWNLWKHKTGRSYWRLRSKAAVRNSYRVWRHYNWSNLLFSLKKKFENKQMRTGS